MCLYMDNQLFHLIKLRREGGRKEGNKEGRKGEGERERGREGGNPC